MDRLYAASEQVGGKPPANRNALIQLKDVAERTEGIMQSVHALEHRLTPALAPYQPDSPTNYNKETGIRRQAISADESVETRLVTILDALNGRLYEIQEKLNDIHRRVEL